MFRFTIRDLLWLMVVVGMGCGWFLHVRYEREAGYREGDRLFKHGIEMQRDVDERAFNTLLWDIPDSAPNAGGNSN
jgi:hypothetical protein